MPADLFLRNDDLAGLGVVGVGNGVVEQADRADYLKGEMILSYKKNLMTAFF